MAPAPRESSRNVDTVRLVSDLFLAPRAMTFLSPRCHDGPAMTERDSQTSGDAAGKAVPVSRLARKLGTGDAVVVGMGSMIGAGVFSAAVHPKHRVPHRAELAVGAGVVLLIAALDAREAIGFSSSTVLAYYAVTNAAALTLSREERRWPRGVAALGLVGCVVLAVSLPVKAAVGGLLALVAGLAAFAIRSMASRPSR